MPLIALFFLLAWTGVLSSCVSHNAEAFTIQQHPIDARQLELSAPVRTYIRDTIGLPKYFAIDELDLADWHWLRARINDEALSWNKIFQIVANCQK